MIEDPHRRSRLFMDFCQALKVYAAADEDTCTTLYCAVDELRPCEAVAALIDAIVAIAQSDVPAEPMSDPFTVLDKKQASTPCPYHLPLMNCVDGQYRRVQVPCGKSWCPDCGVERAQGILDTLQRHFQVCDGVWIAVLDSVDTTMRNRLGSRAGDRHASYAWVRRLNGIEVWFSSRTLGGPKPPYLFTELTPPQALLLARIALLIPYWKTAHASKDWRWPDWTKSRPSSGSYKKITKACGKSTVKLAEEYIADRIGGYSGGRMLGGSISRPDDIPVSEWFDLLKECYEEARLKTGPEPDAQDL